MPQFDAETAAGVSNEPDVYVERPEKYDNFSTIGNVASGHYYVVFPNQPGILFQQTGFEIRHESELDDTNCQREPGLGCSLYSMTIRHGLRFF